MNESLFEIMHLKLEDVRDQSAILVGLGPYMHFSDWIDERLEVLGDAYQAYETHNSTHPFRERKTLV
jgi:hypothetical protein